MTPIINPSQWNMLTFKHTILAAAILELGDFLFQLETTKLALACVLLGRDLDSGLVICSSVMNQPKSHMIRDKAAMGCLTFPVFGHDGYLGLAPLRSGSE